MRIKNILATLVLTCALATTALAGIMSDPPVATPDPAPTPQAAATENAAADDSDSATAEIIVTLTATLLTLLT